MRLVLQGYQVTHGSEFGGPFPMSPLAPVWKNLTSPISMYMRIQYCGLNMGSINEVILLIMHVTILQQSLKPLILCQT